MKQPLMVKFFEENIKKGDTVADIGANIGYFTIGFSDLVGEDGLVLAFEPHYKNRKEILDKLLAHNIKNVKVYHHALTNRNGIGFLFIGKHPSLHSLKSGLKGRTKDVVMIEVSELDEFDFDRPIDGCKIDVEGNDIETLLGASKSLETMRYVGMDVHPTLGVHVEYVKRILRKKGFNLYQVRNEIFATK